MSDTRLCTKRGVTLWSQHLVACAQGQPVACSRGQLRFISLHHPSHACWKLEPPWWGWLAEGCAAGGGVRAWGQGQGPSAELLWASAQGGAPPAGQAAS